MKKQCLLILCFLLIAGAAPAVTYSIQELASLPGGTNGRGANAINEKGQIVGTMRDSSHREHAVIWDDKGSIKDLGTLPGQAVSWGLDINDAGQVVGWSAEEGNRNKHAVLWDKDGKPKDLGTLGGDISEATAINREGWIVGCSCRKEGRLHAFLWKPDQGMVDLGALEGGQSRALDIDDSGRIVGWSTDSLKEQRAVAWEADGTMKNLGSTLVPPESRGIAVTTGSIATAINRKGQIAGKVGGMCGKGNAFLWGKNGDSIDLGLLQNLPRVSGFLCPTPVPSSTPCAVNDRGQVVGWSEGHDTWSHAFFWSKETGMIDLGTLALPGQTDRSLSIVTNGNGSFSFSLNETPFHWSEAKGINNTGIVVGSCAGQAVLWTPGSPH